MLLGLFYKSFRATLDTMEMARRSSRRTLSLDEALLKSELTMDFCQAGARLSTKK